jgi:glucokinase
MAGLVPLPGSTRGWIPLPGEGGHTTLPATDSREADIVEELGGRFGHVSAERVLSGNGLVNLYGALAAIDGDGMAADALPTAAEITDRALAGSDSRATEAVDLFCGWLGTVAGNAALLLGARGGVYIAGGIVPRLGPLLDRSPFRARFEAKGRMQAYLAPIPTHLVLHKLPAFLGLQQALEQVVPGA